jgi:FkbM family methyltransferase
METKVDLLKVEFEHSGRRYYVTSTRTDEYILSKIRESQNFYEYDLLSIVSYLPLKSGVFIDAGANIGNHTIYFSGVLERDVVSFEMDPKNYELLLKNIHDNGLSHRVRAFNFALGSVVGRVAFKRSDQNSGATTRVPESIPHDGTSTAFPLDELSIGAPVSLIKIDVEGDELSVLRGAQKTISQHQPILVVELATPQAFSRASTFADRMGYVPVMVGALTDTYIFCHRTDAAKCNNIMAIYYSRKYEKSLNKTTKDALAFSKEFTRIKALLSLYYERSHKLQLELEAANGRVARSASEAEMWQAAASKICGELELHFTTQAPIPRPRIKGIRSAINQRLQEKTVLKSRPDRLERISLVQHDQMKLPLQYVAIVCNTLSLELCQQVEDCKLRTSLEFREKYYVILPELKDASPNFEGATVVCSRLEAFRQISRDFENCAVCVFDAESGADVSEVVSSLIQSRATHPNDDEILLLDGVDFRRDEATDAWKQGSVVRLRNNLNTTIPVVAPITLNLYSAKGLASLADSLSFDAMATFSAESALALAAAQRNLPLKVVARPRLHVSGGRDCLDLISDELLKSGAKLTSRLAPKKWDIVIVGRLSSARWARGGIFNSCREYAEICDRVGFKYKLVEIDQAPASIAQECLSSKMVLVYTGDQIAQDYFNVEPLVSYLDRQGCSVLVNLSYDTHPERTSEIAELMNNTSPRVKLMAFSRNIIGDEQISRYSDRIVIVPKTIKDVAPRQIHFSQTSGVFMGDLGKFVNPRITANAEGTYAAIKKALPKERIMFVRQYKGDYDLPLWLKGYDLLEYDPNITKEFGNCRIYVHSQNYCTFEMLPVEASIAGIPVLFCNMPQSLNEYIADAGAMFLNSDELTYTAKEIYFSEPYWNALSELGRSRRTRFNPRNTDLAFSRAIRQII